VEKPRAGTPVDEADGLAAAQAAFLCDLAEGKYDKQVAAVQRLLGVLGAFWPPAKVVSRALSTFIMLNKLTAPGVPVVADGAGGFVPEDNSTYDRETGVFTKGPFSWLSRK
jgi:hypothetical protein